MANNTLIGAIRAEATLESGKFVDGAKKIRQETQKTEAVVKSGFSGMGAAIKGFGGAVTAGLSIGVLTGLATKAIQYAKSIKTVSQQLGVTTKDLQEFRYAAQQVGVKIPEADKALEKLGLSMSNALAGSKEAQKAFGAVGVTLTDLKTKSQTEIFGQIADQMNKQGGAAKNAAVGTRLMGEGFSKLVPLADKGSQGLNELSQAAQRLGVVLSDQQIQNADETARKLNDVKMVLAAQISGVVADNANSIVSLAQALGQLTSAIVNFLGSNPQAALGILGALAGSRFGLPGAAAGGIAGVFAGGKLQSSRDASSTDVNYLRGRLTSERDKLQKYVNSNKRGAGLNLGPQTKKVQELTKALGNAIAARNTLVSAPPGLPPAQFLATGGGGKGRKGRTPRAPRDRSDDVAFQFERELRQAQLDVLQAQRGLSDDYIDRRNITIQILELQREEHEAELKNRVRLAERDAAEGKITQGTLEAVKLQADQLRLEYDKKHALEIEAANLEEQARAREEVARFAEIDFDNAREKLELESQLADTAAEQRDVQLRLLDLFEKHERAKLNTIMAENAIGSTAWEEARRRLAALNETSGARRNVVLEGTKGPWEDYIDKLPTTTEKWNEALENVAANGLRAVEDGIVDILTGAKSVGEALQDILGDIIQQLIRIGVQRLIGSAIGGFAGGGYTGQGGKYEPAGIVHRGEYVFDSASTKQLGVPFLEALRMGKMPGMSMGGYARGLPIARTSYSERVSVSNDNASMRGGGDSFHFSFPGVRDAREARVAGIQAAHAMKGAVARSAKVNS